MIKFLAEKIYLNSDAAARATSAIVSFFVIVFIYIGAISEKYLIYMFGWLVLHMVSQLYLALSDNKVHVCCKCGKRVKPQAVYKHKCRK